MRTKRFKTRYGEVQITHHNDGLVQIEKGASATPYDSRCDCGATWQGEHSEACVVNAGG